MVDKKVAAGAAVLAIAAGAAYALSRAEAAPVEEGAPEGEVSLVITPLGMPEGFSFDDVEGYDPGWGVGSVVKVNGKCTAGFPVPSMDIDLYDGPTEVLATLRSTKHVASATIDTTFTLTETMGAADYGTHFVYGKMRLTNPIGTFEWTSTTKTFDIGIEPPGEVTIDFTLT